MTQDNCAEPRRVMQSLLTGSALCQYGEWQELEDMQNCDTLLHGDTKYTGDDDDAMYKAMQLVEADSDTIREALNILVMAALEYPEPFRKARGEVDRHYVKLT